MRTFTLTRGHDESGVSGTGVVLEGVEFTDGRVILEWTSLPRSTVVWDTFEEFWQIHVASHPTNDSLVWFSDGVRRYQDPVIQADWEERKRKMREDHQATILAMRDVA